MGAFLAIVWNGFREARRNRVTVIVGAFALALLFSTTLVTQVTINTFDRVVTDFGLGTMSLMLVLLTMYLSCGLLSREIERRTIFLMVSKPLSRSTFLLGRLFGNLLTLLVLLVVMSALFMGELKLNFAPITQPQLASLVGLFFELVLLASAGFLFSTFASQTVSGIITLSLYFIGHLSTDMYKLAERSDEQVLKALGKAAYYLLPNLDRLNFRPMATYAVPVAGAELTSSIVYAVGYSAVLVLLACFIFERRDFK